MVSCSLSRRNKYPASKNFPSLLMSIIKVPKSPAVQFSLAEKTLHFLLRIILWWVPKGSPDYDKRNDDVAYWLVEIEDGRAEREIGFDTHNNPILHAPTDRNMGLWTDSDRIFIVAEYEIVSTQEFNHYWTDSEK